MIRKEVFTNLEAFENLKITLEQELGWTVERLKYEKVGLGGIVRVTYKVIRSEA